MDLTNPLRTIAPSADMDVLGVLLRTHAPLTGRRIAELAERSHTRVRLILQRFTSDGLVSQETLGTTNGYVLNRQHVLVPALEAMQHALPTVLDRIREAVAEWKIPPSSVMVFGSAARGEAESTSDIDLLLIRPDDVDFEDDTWSSQRYDLARAIEAWAGNDTQIVEVSVSEFAKAVRTKQPLIRNLREDGIVLAGSVPGL